MDDMRLEAARLSRCLGQLSTFGDVPYGKQKPSRYAYEVLRQTGNGSWSRVLYTHDRQHALQVFETLPKRGRWITLQNVLNGEILGSMGRAPRNVQRLIQNVLNDLAECENTENLRIKDVRYVSGMKRTVHLIKSKREMLIEQLRVYVRMTVLPEEGDF